MKKWLQDLQWLMVFTLVWIVLFEKLTWQIALSGFFVSVLCLMFTEKFLIGDSYYKHYPINLWHLIQYALYLVVAIYKAGFQTLWHIFTGQINPRVVHIETSLEDDYLISILANSITLTPGTITVEKEGQKLIVLWLDATSRHPSIAGAAIKSDFEKRLANFNVVKGQQK